MLWNLGILVWVVLLVVGAHVALDAIADSAERRLRAYLWKEEDYLRLFSPANYVGRGPHRLLIIGPSEAREALLPEELEAMLPNIEPFQNSLSQGTLEDSLVVLDYIEKAYGRSAVPRMLELGITTRFIADIRPAPRSPLLDGINKYSPSFALSDQLPPALVPRTRFDSMRARLALLSKQPERYRMALFAIASNLLMSAQPHLATDPRFWQKIRPAKYLRGRLWSVEGIENTLKRPGWKAVHAWDPEMDRDRIIGELRLLRDYTSRHRIELYVVNLPEISWNRSSYSAGRWEAYIDAVRTALSDTPFLDLRTFLTDEEFYDSGHATWAGSIRVSKSVAAFIAQQSRKDTNTTALR